MSPPGAARSSPPSRWGATSPARAAWPPAGPRSTDGGSTWSDGLLPGVTTATGGPYPNTADNTVAYDARHGTWLAASLGIGLQNGKYAELALVVNRSSDGLSWSPPVTVTSVGEPDKDWITCDNTSTSPYYGHCYAVYSSAAFGDMLEMAVSTDGGLTWAPGVETADLAVGYDVQPVVRPDGTVVVVATVNGTGLIATRSTDGGATWSAATSVGTVQHHKVAGGLREKAKPTVGVDGAGRVYAMWSDCRFRASCAANDLVLATSATGTTWSAPARVALTPTGATDDFFLPALGVDAASSGSTGRLAASWYHLPKAACGSTCLVDVGVATSGDGGATWTSPTRVSAQMKPTWLPLATNGRMAGDYFGTVFAAGNAVSVHALAGPPSSGTLDVAMHATVYGPRTVSAAGVHAVSTTSPGVAHVPVVLGAVQPAPVTVSWSTRAGTAVAGTDYVAGSGTVTIPAGSGGATIDVALPAVSGARAPVAFSVHLAGASGAVTVGSDAVVTLSSALGTPSVSVGDVQVVERLDGTPATAAFPVTLAAPAAAPVSVTFATVDGTATVAAGDYTARSGTLTIPAGELGVTVPVSVTSDGGTEAAEVFRLTLSAGPGVTVGDSSGTATVLSPVGAPRLAVDDVAVVEGSGGTTTASVPVRLPQPADVPVTVAWATSDGTALAGQDYTARSGSLTIPAGATGGTLAVPVTPDTTDEANETFRVTLSGAGPNVVLADAVATVTVVDDDGGPAVAPPPSWSADDVTLVEPASGQLPAAFALRLSAPAPGPTSVRWATSNAGATAGSDYTASSGTLTLAAGATSGTVSVPVLADAAAEPGQSFTLTLSAPTGSVLGDATATGTVYDPVGAPTLAAADLAVVEGTGGTSTAVLVVRLSAPTDQKVTVRAVTAAGSAKAGSDFSGRAVTLTFPVGATTASLSVPVTTDTVSEPDETFTVKLSSPKGGARVADGAATLTVLDDD